jgi:hypothetical protein
VSPGSRSVRPEEMPPAFRPYGVDTGFSGT